MSNLGPKIAVAKPLVAPSPAVVDGEEPEEYDGEEPEEEEVPSAPAKPSALSPSAPNVSANKGDKGAVSQPAAGTTPPRSRGASTANRKGRKVSKTFTPLPPPRSQGEQNWRDLNEQLRLQTATRIIRTYGGIERQLVQGGQSASATLLNAQNAWNDVKALHDSLEQLSSALSTLSLIHPYANK